MNFILSKSFLIFFICASILFVYPASIIFLTNITGDTSSSRLVTIPIRLMILAALFLTLTLSKIEIKSASCIFLSIFSLVYFFRIWIEVITGAPETYQSPVEFVLYFLSFFFAPVFVFSIIDARDIDWGRIARNLIWSSWIFLLPVLFFYASFVGKVQRSEEVVQLGGVWVNPLMLSYAASYIIVLLLANFKLPSEVKVSGIHASIIFICALVPLILGASRGSMLGIILVALTLVLSAKNSISKIVNVLLALVALGCLILLSIWFETGPLFRLIETFSGEASPAQNARLVRWSQGLEQFSSAPLFGDALVLHASNNYPHNVFIEVLISTGVIGAAVFLCLSAFKFRDFLRLRRVPSRFWIMAIFVLAVVGANFSGNITNQAYLGLAFGLITLAGRSQRARLDSTT